MFHKISRINTDGDIEVISNHNIPQPGLVILEPRATHDHFVDFVYPAGALIRDTAVWARVQVTETHDLELACNVRLPPGLREHIKREYPELVIEEPPVTADPSDRIVAISSVAGVEIVLLDWGVAIAFLAKLDGETDPLWGYNLESVRSAGALYIEVSTSLLALASNGAGKAEVRAYLEDVALQLEAGDAS